MLIISFGYGYYSTCVSEGRKLDTYLQNTLRNYPNSCEIYQIALFKIGGLAINHYVSKVSLLIKKLQLQNDLIFILFGYF